MTHLIALSISLILTKFSYSQSDSLKYAELLSGGVHKQWYLEKESYLGTSKKRCKLRTLLIFSNNQLIEESCDKKSKASFTWKIYRNPDGNWWFSYGRKNYRFSITDYPDSQKLIFMKRDYTSKRTLTYIHYKD